MRIGVEGRRAVVTLAFAISLVSSLLFVDRAYAPLPTDDSKAAYDLLHPPPPPSPPPPPPKWYERWSQSVSDWWNRDRLLQQQRELQKLEQDYQQRLSEMIREQREQSER